MTSMRQDNIFGGNNSWESLESVLKIMTLRANWQDVDSNVSRVVAFLSVQDVIIVTNSRLKKALRRLFLTGFQVGSREKLRESLLLFFIPDKI